MEYPSPVHEIWVLRPEILDLWSETMDADTWAAFQETGNVWDPATAKRFADVLLSTGNVVDRAEAYRAFRGRDPDVSALLRKRGFPTGGGER